MSGEYRVQRYEKGGVEVGIWRLWGRRLLTALLLGAALVGQFSFFTLTEQLKKWPGTRILSLEQGISLTDAVSQMERVRETGNHTSSEMILTEAAFWGVEPSVVLEEKARGISVFKEILVLYGNPQVILPEFAFDGAGLYLDEETAGELWGTLACAGGQLRCRNRDWPCRGIWDGDQPLWILSGEEPLTVEFSRFALYLAAGEENWYLWCEGLPIGERQWQPSLYTELAALAGDVALLLWTAALLTAVRRCLRVEMQPQRRVVFLLMLAAGLLLLTRMYLLFFSLPLDYVPGQWSDFSFWGRLWSEKGEILSQLWREREEIFDLSYGQAFRRILLCGVGAGLLLIFGSLSFLREMEGKTGQKAGLVS